MSEFKEFCAKNFDFPLGDSKVVVEKVWRVQQAEIERLKSNPIPLLSCEAAKRAIKIFESEYIGGQYTGEAVTGLWKYSVKEAMDGEASDE